MNETCGFEGCGKPLYIRGLCNGHYGQLNRGQDLRPLRPRRVLPADEVDYIVRLIKAGMTLKNVEAKTGTHWMTCATAFERVTGMTVLAYRTKVQEDLLNQEEIIQAAV